MGCSFDQSKLPVTGIVQSGGKPIAQATIAFVSEDGSSITSAVTDANGRFRATVGRGKKKISVSKVSLAASAPQSDDEMVSPTDAELAKARQAALATMEIPARFADPNQSGLSCEVTASMQPLSIDVSE